MKSNLILTSTFLLLLSVLFSCTPDPCKDVNCQNGGTCIEGECACPAGYTGDNCEILIVDCGAVTCTNGGVCVDGSCVCPNGYDGIDCANVSRTKVIGNYDIVRSCAVGSTVSWSAALEEVPGNIAQFQFTDFAGSFLELIYGEMTGATTFDIPEQVVSRSNGDTFTLSGEGEYNTSTQVVTLTYTITDGTDSETCDMTLTP